MCAKAMADQMDIIFNNSGVNPYRLSVLIPVKNDQRLHRLLDALALQARDDVQVCVINDLRPEPIITKLPAPLTVTSWRQRHFLILTGSSLLLF